MASVSVYGQLRERAMELLADGEWHDFEEILAQVGKLVPPGVALRRVEKNRIKGGSRFPERVEQEETSRLIAYGRRQAAREALDSSRSRGPRPFEIVPPGQSGRRRVKIPRRIRLANHDGGIDVGTT